MPSKTKKTTVRKSGKNTTTPKPKRATAGNIADVMPIAGVIGKHPNPTKKLPTQKVAGRKKGK